MTHRPGSRPSGKPAAAVDALCVLCTSRPDAAALLLHGEDACLAALTAAEPEPGRADVVVQVVRPDTVQTLRDGHLRVRLPHPQPWPSIADVLVAPGPSDLPWRKAAARARALAGSHPGALVVAVHGPSQCVVRAGGDRLLRLTARPGDRPHWPTWASLLHAWLVAGVPAGAPAPAAAHLCHLPPGDGTTHRPARGQTITLHPLP